MTGTTVRPEANWEADNNAYLGAGLAWLRDRLGGNDERDTTSDGAGWWDDERWVGCAVPPALELLGDRLGLSRFERLVLLLCASVELDPGIVEGWAGSGGDPPSFALAMSMLPAPAWDVLSTRRPLRYWRLIEVHQRPGHPLVTAPLHADERIVNYLKGLNHLDGRLEHLTRPVGDVLGNPLPESQQRAVDEAVAAWLEPAAPGRTAAIELLGVDEQVLRGIAWAVADRVGLVLHELIADRVPQSGMEAAEWLRLWERETLLSPVALYVDVSDLDRASHSSLASSLADLDTALLVGCREPWPIPRCPIRLVDARRPTAAEQEEIWRDALTTDGTDDRSGEAERMVTLLSSRLDLNQVAIRAAARTVAHHGEALGDVWRSCQAHTRPRLEALALWVDTAAGWDDLVLPERELTLLHHLVDQVRGRTQVLRHWGFGDRMTRGSGVTALFAGQSGTGKSLAAEVVAHELGLSLYRVDLSGVVSKYIGETERNLRRVFDAADEGGALLLFDEADALFGKRSEVRDSHDRYANIEVNYLLQRMEDYRGVAVLTTNQRHALDQAFLRRLRFVVSFPFPSPAERRALWERAFPPRSPVEDLDIDRLVTLAATGGMIRNIALNAAFCAAGQGAAISTRLVLEMARVEFHKLELPLNDQDFRWVGSVTG
ncbi:MAG TPA: ATP-binding protein [Pseudonocardiaceae bacterium]|jgi:hypothetical protein